VSDFRQAPKLGTDEPSVGKRVRGQRGSCRDPRFDRGCPPPRGSRGGSPTSATASGDGLTFFPMVPSYRSEAAAQHLKERRPFAWGQGGCESHLEAILDIYNHAVVTQRLRST